MVEELQRYALHVQAQFERARREQAHWLRFAERVPAVDWSEQMSVPRSSLVLSAKSWRPFRTFPEVCDSPCGTWRYDTVELPKGRPIDVLTHAGKHKVVFDGDIEIPRVCEFSEERSELWMSYTPQEVLTQRPGLRKAKGKVIIVGLGMGWLLQRVMAKKSVKKVVLVERSRELIDWVLPAIESSFPDKPLDVVVGDAYGIVQKMTADVALWDIWESLGAVDQTDEKSMATGCPGIKATWFWGATAKIPNTIWG
jgi:hypothetical protein